MARAVLSLSSGYHDARANAVALLPYSSLVTVGLGMRKPATSRRMETGVQSANYAHPDSPKPHHGEEKREVADLGQHIVPARSSYTGSGFSGPHPPIFQGRQEIPCARSPSR